MAEDQNRTLQDKFMLRLPDGMRDRLKDAAFSNNRSMNAEIIARLEHSFLTHAEANPEIAEKLDSFSDTLADFKKSLEKWEPEKLIKHLDSLMKKPGD